MWNTSILTTTSSWNIKPLFLWLGTNNQAFLGKVEIEVKYHIILRQIYHFISRKFEIPVQIYLLKIPVCICFICISSNMWKVLHFNHLCQFSIDFSSDKYPVDKNLCHRGFKMCPYDPKPLKRREFSLNLHNKYALTRETT